MPVVINEFEVTPAPAETPPAPPKKESPPAPEPTDHELRKLLERRLEREERIEARN